MALVPCVVCRQPFYASCHDASCTEALCPLCEYAAEMDDATVGGAVPPLAGTGEPAPTACAAGGGPNAEHARMPSAPRDSQAAPPERSRLQ